jgi:hypothetical protein
MSTLKVDGIRSNSASSDAITLASDGTCTANITNNLSNRNLVINGAMQVAQRGTVTGVSSGYGGPDRFKFQSNHSAVTMSQSTDVPTGEGFVKSLKLDVTTAGGISNANTYTEIDYFFEGQDLQSLCYGTSNAKSITLTFWIKSPKTGTHWIRLYSSEIGNKFNAKKYTVTAANTWQKVTLTFGGYTSQGFDNDNTDGMRVSWYFGQGSDYTSGTDADADEWIAWHNNNAAVGQVNCFDSTSNDIYLTGVQLEVGSTATDFEHRSYGQELALCQRYFHKWSASDGNSAYMCMAPAYSGDTDRMDVIYQLPVQMRASPSFSTSGNSRYVESNSVKSISNLALNRSHVRTMYLRADSSSLTAGRGGEFGANNDSSFQCSFSAEL